MSYDHLASHLGTVQREREREYIVWVQQSVGTLDASFNRIPIQTEAQSQQMCLSNSCFELISL